MSSLEHSPADSIWERREARRRLRLLQIREALAVRSETAPTDHLRAGYADFYRQLVGVHPSQREEFRAALERIAEGGGMPVQDLIDTLRRRYSANGLASADGAGN